MTLPRRSSGPRVWPWCDRQQTTSAVREGDLGEKKTSHGWMGRCLTKFSSWQPLLNKHGMVWWRPKGAHSLIFFHSVSTLFPYLSSLNWDLYIRLTFLVFSFLNFLCCLSPFPLSLSHFCGIFPSVHLSISLSCRIQQFPLCHFQSDPSSDKYSFQRPFTGNEPISWFSLQPLLAGNLTCE